MSIDRVSDPVKGRARAPHATRRPSPPPARGRRAPVVARPAGRESVDRAALVAYLGRVTRVLRRHRVLLDRLDAALGDGDHGENMSTGFGAVLDAGLDPAPTADLGALLRSAGHVLVASVGGASGPLYGTAFIEAGFSLGGSTRGDPPAIADALDAAVRGLARRGRCDLGDKTILDALQPAAVAFRSALEAGEPAEQALRAAAWAAHRGMRATTPLVARRGLALRLGERSRGHQDPGATSCFLLVRAMLPPRGRAPGRR
jgi:phosphoenolpyruvate---glycerone phosphotransferase subunit DhaL